MPAKKHTHKYHKVSLNGQDVWACALPDCTHYMPKHMEFAVIGKKSICWSCDLEFILTGALMNQDNPKCRDCSPAVNRIMDVLEEMESFPGKKIGNE